jgi:sigma-54 specific flagellar transcriptional regulator A
LTDSAIEKIVGSSDKALKLKKLIELVGPSVGSVLIQGPTGSGKELVAEAIHEVSERPGEFVAINCAAIPKDLLESELFGYEKGAFTGADRKKEGRFEQASNGTLFLDEIGDMSPDLQSKLLRVIETQKVQRIGGRENIEIDVRIISASHKNLEEMTNKGSFRADLMYRLNVFPIIVPSLKERTDDIPELIDALIRATFSRKQQQDLPQFNKDGIRALSNYSWPGNIRELKNIILRASVLFPSIQISGEHVTQNLLRMQAPEHSLLTAENTETWDELSDLEAIAELDVAREKRPPSVEDFRVWFEHYPETNVRRLLSEIEVVLIEAALTDQQGHVAKAAEKLMLRRTTLIEKMKKYGISQN